MRFHARSIPFAIHAKMNTIDVFSQMHFSSIGILVKADIQNAVIRFESQRFLNKTLAYHKGAQAVFS